MVMKRFFLTIAVVEIIIFLNPGISNAQSYIPFVKEGKVWTEASTLCGYPYYLWLNVSRMQGDTLIGGNTYKKVYDENDDYVCAVYEDTIEKRVFCNRTGLGSFLLYDFNLQVGDTLFELDSFPLVVYGRDSVFFAGKNRLRLDFDLWPSNYVYEGIGAMSQGVFLPKGLVGGSTELLCYFEDDSLLYHNDVISTDCFVLTSVDENIPESVSINVCVSNKRIVIKAFSDEDFQFRLFSIEGKEILSFKGAGTNIINADHLNNQLYIYSLHFSKSNVFKTGKLKLAN